MHEMIYNLYIFCSTDLGTNKKGSVELFDFAEFALISQSNSIALPCHGPCKILKRIVIIYIVLPRLVLQYLAWCFTYNVQDTCK